MRCSPEELAWLAGILDGEGSICLYKQSAGGYLISNIQITNSDDAILAEVERILQALSILYRICNAHSAKVYREKPNLKPCYHIVLTRQLEQKALLEYLLPYIKGEKKLKALQLIEWIETHKRPDGKASSRKKKFVGKEEV